MPSPGACDVVDDPHLDARQAHPLWMVGADDLLRVRPAGRRPSTTTAGFDLWRVPGRKRISLRDDELVLTACVGVPWLRAVLDGALSHGAPFHCTVPLGAGLRGQLAQFNVQARLLAGGPVPPSVRGAGRSALLHLRALQAIDAFRAGRHHRDIAEVLFGADAVRRRWSADGELRAHVRHLLARAEGLVRGGYLTLAGVRHDDAEAAGDEPGP